MTTAEHDHLTCPDCAGLLRRDWPQSCVEWQREDTARWASVRPSVSMTHAEHAAQVAADWSEGSGIDGEED
jgi:hypothetical protein